MYAFGRHYYPVWLLHCYHHLKNLVYLLTFSLGYFMHALSTLGMEELGFFMDCVFSKWKAASWSKLKLQFNVCFSTVEITEQKAFDL